MDNNKINTEKNIDVRTTSQTHTPAQQVEDRFWEFADSFGEDLQFEHDLMVCIETTARIAALCFGEEEADQAFKGMVAAHLHVPDAGMSWRQVLEEEINGLYSELPIGTLFHDLQAYADYGISTLSALDIDQRRASIEKLVNDARDVLALIPVEQWGLDFTYLSRMSEKAIVRWKLDSGDPITATELACISNRAFQTIKNNLGNSGKPIVGNTRRITAQEALLWLESLQDYRESLWQHQDDTEVVAVIDEPLERVAFVPVSTDGSVFTPEACRRGTYIVGREGAEHRYEDYDAALQHLQSMLVPFWQRPTEKGIWTRVKGVSWQRLSLAGDL